MIAKSNRFSFSGHDSFQCRLLWLKKGYDFLTTGHVLSEDGAGVILGVGNNMVRAIRFWMRAFGITDENDVVTDFGNLIFGGDEALDPFLEDEATLWILHYRLVTIGYASSYGIIFNEFRKNKIEFTREDFLNYVNLKLEERSQSVSSNSINEDFTVFVKMYLGSEGNKDKEESFSGILTELNLLQFFVKQKDDMKKESENVYYIAPSERSDMPEVVILYAILENSEYQNSIGLNQLDVDQNSPGSVFALTKEGLRQKLRKICNDNEFVTLNEQAGITELQFKNKPTSHDILKKYYATQERYTSI